MSHANEESILRAVAGLDAWFDGMRGPQGYGGPVVHWWRDSLHFTGSGLDWRYEGIISGYLNLWKSSGDKIWLEKARRAGDDILRGQLPTGNFRHSGFELNPSSGGTPHESACDLALFLLAKALKVKGDPDWSAFSDAAARNLQNFILSSLWDPGRERFHNTIEDAAFVPNKAATLCQALFAWAELQGDDQVLEHYARPTLETILDCQVRSPGSPVDGAISQNDAGRGAGAMYFPFYVARCIPALIQVWRILGDERYLEAAREAMAFILRYRLEDGSIPQVVYGDGRINRYPEWIAGTGDILRAMQLLQAEGLEINFESTLGWLLGGVRPDGGIRTAHGFAAQSWQKAPGDLPEFRDLLSVCGWADKAFHFLTGLVVSKLMSTDRKVRPLEQDCVYRGNRALFREDGQRLELVRGGETLYRWRKGEAWAEVYQV